MRPSLIALAIVACQAAPPESAPPPPVPVVAPHAMTARERERAIDFTAQMAPVGPRGSKWNAVPVTPIFADIDEDGVADCFSQRRDDTQGIHTYIWPGCSGDPAKPAIEFRTPVMGITELRVPAIIATPGWTSWLARRNVRDDRPIACSDGNPCTLPPEWRWVIAADKREPQLVGVRGMVAPDWLPLATARLTGAAIVGDRILFDPESRDLTPVHNKQTCGGFMIGIDDIGIWEIDDTRWAWLFRDLPDFAPEDRFRGYHCIDGLVVAAKNRELVILDPTNGAWFVVQTGKAHRIPAAASKMKLWDHDANGITPLPELEVQLKAD